jgi:hypothetical protein
MRTDSSEQGAIPSGLYIQPDGIAICAFASHIIIN